MDPTIQVLLAIFGGLTAATAIIGLVAGLVSKPIRRLEGAIKDTEKNLKGELTSSESRLEDRLEKIGSTLISMRSELTTINNGLQSLRTSQAALFAAVESVMPEGEKRVAARIIQLEEYRQRHG